ncbi:MAG: FtsQ-type POTRA domain-containing protein [Kordiimonadaceae bacterium]|nr:FtsQ-type POTRA domain-containing protein [Kordiimonadaceae bacterium]MBT6031383.1 FtsQ-type POTRA domain-containing protein [Kordiimonadaceae bacterium]
MRAIKQNPQKTISKRGEKEAKSLRRRRLVKSTIRVISVLGISIATVGSIYLWQSGSVETWFNNAETKVEDSLIDAGLTVEEIYIEGELQTTGEEIDATLNISLGDPLLAIDINAIKERIEILEWIKTATITRKLPDTLVVNVIEHQPAALWQIDNKLWLLSDEGFKITDKQLEYFSDLPMISGAGADRELENLLIIVKNGNDLFNRVETASWVGGRRWDLILNNGIKIMLPEYEMKNAWVNLLKFEKSEQLLARNILAVDFRVKGKTVVRLTPDEADRRRLMAKTSGKGEDI